MDSKENTKITALFKAHHKHWSTRRFFEHKFDAYKNNQKKIYTFNKGNLFMETPYKENENMFGFYLGVGKVVDEETLTEYYKEITQTEFFRKQITHIPVK